jgi:hypothetical protein
VAKKRGNGEGSITRRKNRDWCAQYVVWTSEGRKRKTLYGKTRAEVAGKLTKALSNREDGLVFDAGSLDRSRLPGSLAYRFGEGHGTADDIPRLRADLQAPHKALCGASPA